MSTGPLRDPLGYNSTGADNEVIVCVLSDLPEPVAGVITLLAATEYRICGIIDLGTDRLVASLNTIIDGAGPAISGFQTNNAAALLTATASLQCDDVSFMNAGGPCLDLQAVGGLITLFDVFFMDSVSCGTISNCERAFLDFITIEGCADGLTFDGTIRDVFIESLFCEANTGTFTAVTLPATFTSSLVDVAVGFIETDAGQTGFDVDNAATIQSLDISDVDVLTPANALGTFSAPVYATLKAQPRVRCINNPGRADSVARGGIAITGNTTEDTVITTQSVFVPVGEGNGSHPVYVQDANSERVSLQGATAALGVLRYDGLEIDNAVVSVSMSVEPAAGGAIEFAARLTLDGVLVPNSVFTSTSNTGGQPGSLSFTLSLEITNLEELQIEVANDSSTADLTVRSVRLAMF